VRGILVTPAKAGIHSGHGSGFRRDDEKFLFVVFNGRRGAGTALLDFAECDRAWLARDPAYDGRFFTGVRTTGVYWRPAGLPGAAGTIGEMSGTTHLRQPPS
jgi:hypothetical protein